MALTAAASVGDGHLAASAGRCHHEAMLRMLELLGGISVALDLGTGSALDESLSRSLVGARLAKRAGLAADDVRDVLYASLLEHLGCTAYAHELALVLGDDVAATRAAFQTDWAAPGSVLRTFVPELARATGSSRARVLARVVRNRARLDRDAPTATCEVARTGARRLGLSPAVQSALGHVTAMWNGAGHPDTQGAQIPLAARLVHVAQVVTLFGLYVDAGVGIQEVRRRSGTSLDPDLVDLVTPDLLEGLDEEDPYESVLAVEPAPVLRVERDAVPRAAAIFGDLVDLKSPWLQGHSDAVSSLATRAGESLGLSSDDVWTLRVAGHLHDLGRIAVSSRIWDRSRPLTVSERAQAELHPWHTEQVLARVPALAGVARVAGQHHERLDGSGYHRRATAGQLGMPSRVLATADRYRCLVEGERSGSPLPSEAVAVALTADAAEGRLDADAVAAVLTAAGHRSRARRPRPAGLTARQVDVLRLVASGRSNKEIAATLVISRRTAEHHVQGIYARIGASTRAGAAMFAMEHGLLDAADADRGNGPRER